MNEGEVSTRLGLRGQSPQAESVMVARDIELCEATGARYHVAHASCEYTFTLVREARQKGLPVSCEVTPHHFTLTEVACCGYDTDTKVAPPLRTARDKDAAKAALADGTADCIATDHAPHSDLDKNTDFDSAAFGMVGLETAVGLALELVREGVITLPKMVELLTSAPAKLFDLDKRGAGALLIGGRADLCVIDTERPWVVDRQALLSKSKNTPFHGREMRGGNVLTLFGGASAFDPLGWLVF